MILVLIIYNIYIAFAIKSKHSMNILGTFFDSKLQWLEGEFLAKYLPSGGS